ncbi:hypothetical protein Syun_008454 [Stephania yunnanensis]|uniref:Diacylglycerol O-acyltransferase n=1 Tax=Stephania yunnanensis TaxID=152371 RepID=A0AAP0PQ07_9MAGN
MITDSNGVKRWKRINPRLEDHVKKPKFPDGLSVERYDAYFQEYLTEVATGQLPQWRPLWELHIFTYPTSSAAGAVIFKLHHSLGDGYSLMGALFSCFRKLDDPSLPPTLPSLGFNFRSTLDEKSITRKVPRLFSMLFNTFSDFTWSLFKSSVLKDDKSPIRSGAEGVEFLPITISTVSFSLDVIKQIKTNLGATVNDVISGMVFYGTRIYMEAMSKGSSKANSTALVLLNTRAISSYQIADDQDKADASSSKSLWGNQFAFLHVPVPASEDVEAVNPLRFVSTAKNIIKRQRSSLGFILTGRLLEMIRKCRGPEVAAQYVHGTLKNTSMALSNMIGPVEKIGLAGHPCKGMYFMMVGGPQSLTLTLVSYMGNLRVAVGAEKGFIDHNLFIKCLEKAFERIHKAAMTI